MNTAEMPWECPECKKRFEVGVDMDKHLKDEHGWDNQAIDAEFARQYRLIYPASFTK